MKTPLFLALFLVACSGPEPTCAIGGVLEFYSEVPTRCEVAQRNIELAYSIAVRRGLLPAGERCRAFQRVSVGVVESLPYGRFDEYTNGHVALTPDMRGLLHGFLHAWDAIHFAVGTSWHENWETNGYTDASIEYGRRARDPSVPLDEPTDYERCTIELE